LNRLARVQKVPRGHRRENYGKAPWHEGPVRALRLLAAYALVFSVTAGLMIGLPVAAAQAAGLGLLGQIAAPFVAFVLLVVLVTIWAMLMLSQREEASLPRALGTVLTQAQIDVNIIVDRPPPSRRQWTATPDRSMGAWLRREREERGVSLSDIAAKTRISLVYLRAIEADRFDALPGGLLIRSFLRQYALHVGLTPATVIALFEDYVDGRMSARQLPPTFAPPSALATTAPPPVQVELSSAKAPASHRAATTIFSVIEAALPKRLANEELGDALEYIAAHPRGWRVWVKIVSTIFWTGLNTVREWRSAFGGKD
jgi:transcriptional regulator with XRE-family HTH domain